MNATLIRSAGGASAFVDVNAGQARTLDVGGTSWPKESDPRPMRSWATVKEDIRKFSSLKDDWDGEGTPALDPQLIQGAISLADYFDLRGQHLPDRVSPGINGTIYFEWQTVIGHEEVEVLNPTVAEYRLVRKGAKTAEVSTIRGFRC